MNQSIYLKLLILLIIVVSSEMARILAVFPTPSISHQVAFRPLILELVNKGHEVVVITTDPMFPKAKSPKNLTEIDVHDISYAVWKKFISTSSGKKKDTRNQQSTAFEVMTIIFEKQIQGHEVQSMIRNKNIEFDLIFAEAWFRPILFFSYFYKVPAIQISSMGPLADNYDTIGAASHPLLYPLPTRKRLYNLTMWDKISEICDHYWLKNYIYNHENVENEMLRRNFGNNIPSVCELCNNVHMLFLNTHPMWAGNVPVPPSVIHMGGVHIKPEKPLQKDLKDYLDSSVNGVIYMSFGTNTKPSLLPADKIQAFVNVFSRMPYKILWKWDKDVLPGQTTNIRIGKWFPQADLLRHPKIKLFITQGGMQSTDEAITAGVPLLGIPMMGDQWYNVEKYVHHKIGLQLDLESLTEEDFKKAIDEIIEDKSFRDNVVRLRTLMHDQPETPLQRAVWWTEHVLRHGGAAHLRAPAANMHWTRYYEIELVVTLLGGLIGFFSVNVLILYLLYTFVTKHLSAKVKVKNQ